MAQINVNGSSQVGAGTVRLIASVAYGGFPAATVRDRVIANAGSPCLVDTKTLDTTWSVYADTEPAGATAEPPTATYLGPLPAGAKMLCLLPPDETTETITVAGATGDVGYPVAGEVGAMLGLTASEELWLKASAEVADVLLVFI